VGSLDRDLAFAEQVRRATRGNGLRDRVRFAGPRTGSALDRAYAGADLLVLASRAETYGMVVTEAFARGLPVVASDVGGVREALCGAGVLVPPDDPGELAAALRRWLTDAGHRAEQRAAARSRRTTLAGWDRTVARMAEALEVLR
jgi:glycosyltransferase involved in cell wall biosynthesis